MAKTPKIHRLAASPPLDGTGTAAPQDQSGDGALRPEGHQRMTGAVLAGILVSLLSLVVAVFSAYSSYRSSKAADESASTAKASLEIAKVAAQIHARPRLAFHLEGYNKAVILKNAGDLDAVDLELIFSVCALAADDGDALVTASGSGLITNWDRLKSGARKSLRLPMSDLKSYLTAQSPTQKAILFHVAYRREGDRMRYEEFAFFFFLDDTLAPESNERIEGGAEYRRIVNAVKNISRDSLVDLDMMFKLLAPFPPLPLAHD